MDLPLRSQIVKLLTMNAQTAAIVVIVPENMDILRSDCAGRPVAEYLLGNLNDWDEGEVKVAASGDGGHRSVLQKFPDISECRLTALHAEMRGGRGLLIIDARAWFSVAALAAISLQIRGAAGSLRFVESEAGIFAAHREAMTLAVYVAPEEVCQDMLVSEHTGAGQGIEHILNAQAIACAHAVTCSDLDPAHPAFAVVSRVDLAELERRLLLERAIAAMKQGTLIRDPARTYIRGDLVCGSDVEIDTNVIIEGKVILGQGVKIGANSILKNCQIGDKTSINPFSLVEQSSVGAGSFVGPYGRIRPGSAIGDNVQIGNYVEIKNSRIGDGSRINHHTFIGDAVLAQKVTIGAGTITCNHDGFGTNKTFIARGAYIGSGCNLVAPLHIGQDAVVGAGSTIARDVPAAKLTLARERQTTVESWQGPKSRRRQE
jgi:NDP-sugar pyrophosphorylase family protein